MSLSGHKPLQKPGLAPRLFAFIGLVLLVLSGPATAVSVSGLYSARVPVEGTSEQQLNQGYADGLRQVLVRVSGSQDVLAMEGVEGLLSDAESLLLSYQVARDDTGQNILSMAFGAVGVNRALASIDAPVWGANRPLTLAWIAVEDRGARSLVTGPAEADSAQGSWSAAFDAAARKRGLPLSTAPQDFTTNRELLSDIWGQFVGRVKSASADLEHDVLALVRVSRAGGHWRAGWVFDGMSMDAGEESVTAPTPEALAEAVINRWAERYAGRYAVAASEVGDSPQVDIVLRGVNSLEDYARVNKVLQDLTPVVGVGAHRVRDDQLTLRVAFSGELDQLEEYIALDPRFVPMESVATPERDAGSAPRADSRGNGQAAGDDENQVAGGNSGASADEGAGQRAGETPAEPEGESSGAAADGSTMFTYQPVPVDEEEAQQAFESLYEVLYYRWQPASVIGSGGSE